MDLKSESVTTSGWSAAAVESFKRTVTEKGAIREGKLYIEMGFMREEMNKEPEISRTVAAMLASFCADKKDVKIVKGDLIVSNYEIFLKNLEIKPEQLLHSQAPEALYPLDEDLADGCSSDIRKSGSFKGVGILYVTPSASNGMAQAKMIYEKFAAPDSIRIVGNQLAIREPGTLLKNLAMTRDEVGSPSMELRR